MAFRFRKYKSITPIPKKVYETVKHVSDGTGVIIVTFSEEPAYGKSIPNPDDYRLSLLLAAGVKLDKASPVIDENITESDVDFLNNLNKEENETV